MRLGQLADAGTASGIQLLQHTAARAVCQRGKDEVELRVLFVNHLV